MTRSERERWRSHVEGEADERGISRETAWLIFDLLGPDEAHDGFISMLDDDLDLDLDP